MEEQWEMLKQHLQKMIAGLNDLGCSNAAEIHAEILHYMHELET